jgi:hypothetical protein
MVSLVGSWLTYFLSVFFIFFNAIISNSKGDKQVINIGLVYQNYAPSKAYDKAFNESIRNINTRQAIAYSRNLTSNEYAFSPVVYVLPKGRFFPSEVLDCLCGMMVPNRVSLIVFVTASEDFDETTAASQYFLHMASQTGIPIVAWNADNPVVYVCFFDCYIHFYRVSHFPIQWPAFEYSKFHRL